MRLLQVFTSPDDWPVWASAADWEHDAIDRGPRFDSYALAVEAAVHGAGVAMGRSPFVDGLIDEGRLVAPLPLRVPREQSWHVAWPRGRLSTEAELFRNWLIDQAADRDNAGGGRK